MTEAECTDCARTQLAPTPCSTCGKNVGEITSHDKPKTKPKKDTSWGRP